jgi:protein-histidine N-methyltransferase
MVHRNSDSCIHQNLIKTLILILFATYIPLPSSRKEITLSRRDLFDACFQLSKGVGDDVDSVCGEGSTDAPTLSLMDRKALEFLDASSDLVVGVYDSEVGLKT